MATMSVDPTKESKSDPPSASGDVIQQTSGDFGRWQLRIFLLLSLTRIPASWHQISIVFLAPPVNFTCHDSNAVGVADRGAWSGDPCLTPAQNHTRETLNGTSSGKCQTWSYDRSVFNETVVTEWNLVCDRKHLATLIQSSFMLGNVFGDVLFGMAADRYGRKRPLLVAVALLVLSGTATAFVPWLEGFFLLRFTTAMAVGGTMVTSFVMCMESVGGKWRMIVATLYHVPYGVGYSLMALFAYLVRDWRSFMFIISVPCVALMGYFWVIPESPRWLVAAGRYDRAIDILNKAARTNKLEPPRDDLVDQLKAMNGAAANAKKPTTRDLLRTRHLRTRTLCLCYNWFVSGFCFFGLAQYVGRIGGNIFVNVVIAGSLMNIGKVVCLLTLDRFGRRTTLIGSLLIAGTGSLLILAVPQGEQEWLKTVCALCSLIGLSVSVPTVYLYTVELFPTVLRNNGLGFTSMCARVGSVIAPVAASLSGVNKFLPPLCFGLVALLGVAFCWPLPETAHTRLPHSIDDVENCAGTKHKPEIGTENFAYIPDKNIL